MSDSTRTRMRHRLLQAILLVFLLIVLVAYQNCGPQGVPRAAKSASNAPSSTPPTLPIPPPPNTNGGTTGSPTPSPTPTLGPSPTPPPSTPTPTPAPPTPPPNPCAIAQAAGLPGMFPYDNPGGSNASHVPLFNNLKRSIQCDQFGFNDTSPFWGTEGTANYKIMFAAAHYLQSTRFGTVAQKLKSRNRVIELLEQQANYSGHMVLGGNEQFVADPHTNFWITAMIAISWGAHESNDATVSNLAFQWWAIHFYWLKQAYIGSLSSGEVRIPATRVKGDPSWDVDTKIYRMANGYNYKVGGGDTAAVAYFKKFIARYPNAIPTPQQYLSTGRLRMPIHVRQVNGVRIIWMDQVATPLEPVDWVRSYGSGRDQFEFGRDWLTPVPTE